MLTAWAKKSIAVMRTVGAVPHVTVTNTSEAYIEAISLAGNTRYIPPIPAYSATYAIINANMVESGASSSIGVAFGAGDTTATENDYTLESHITGLNAATPSIVTAFDSTNSRYVARLDFTITNDTGAAVTIREVGLFVRFNTATSRGDAATAGNSRMSFMMDRTVLSSPVTISDGEAATVRYEFAY